MVDAVHGMQQLDEHHEAQEQVGFADRLLLSKTDLVSIEAVQTLSARIRQINPRASIKPVDDGLHLNEKGNMRLAEAIDLTRLQGSACRR